MQRLLSRGSPPPPCHFVQPLRQSFPGAVSAIAVASRGEQIGRRGTLPAAPRSKTNAAAAVVLVCARRWNTAVPTGDRGSPVYPGLRTGVYNERVGAWTTVANSAAMRRTHIWQRRYQSRSDDWLCIGACAGTPRERVEMAAAEEVAGLVANPHPGGSCSGT